MESSTKLTMNVIRCKIFKYGISAFIGSLLLLLIALNTGPQGIPPDGDYENVDISSSEHIIHTRDVENLKQHRHEQTSRRKMVQNICERNGVRPTNAHTLIPSKFDNIYVDDTHKFLYCEIPKVACTNWKRILLVLTGNMNTTNPLELRPDKVHGEYRQKYLKTLGSFAPNEIKHRIDNYLKFVFVRNPLERILSAYRNKFTVSYNDYFNQRYGKTIIRKYRKNPTKQAIETGKGVKFEEFIKYLVDPATSRDQLFNHHWRQFYKLCHPCLMKYDIIGKYDTLEEDVDYTLKELNVKQQFNFPKRPKINGPKTADILAQSYKNISSEDLHRLWQIYAIDFTMFGYEYPDFERH